MKRRSYIKTVLACGASLAGSQVSAQPRPAARNPILLHLDMLVDPAKEQLMIQKFHTEFRPTAMKHQGYIDVKIAKLRGALTGKAPAGMNYRFALTFESEELRQKWIASADHQRVWPLIENTLSDKNYSVLLFDAI
jgi:hypothetical protein